MWVYVIISGRSFVEYDAWNGEATFSPRRDRATQFYSEAFAASTVASLVKRYPGRSFGLQTVREV
jgi:hypothetical protein